MSLHPSLILAGIVTLGVGFPVAVGCTQAIDRVADRVLDGAGYYCQLDPRTRELFRDALDKPGRPNITITCPVVTEEMLR